ncbi:hypothetical protein QAD02_012100 [Eretmocerus hayati]|uniref:Uncharacterized protein n=1 Tax=Eretmocerus hayati TaxID=131215 RepID=A0ACC2NYQ1_9HYME|nr:hypothetical protein QAD02_012100 [Eretmocerus hayati]
MKDTSKYLARGCFSSRFITSPCSDNFSVSPAPRGPGQVFGSQRRGRGKGRRKDLPTCRPGDQPGESDDKSSDDGLLLDEDRIDTMDLNGERFEAVLSALKYKILVIQGPPETGKSKTCVKMKQNLIIQNGQIKVLVCASSNVVVDVLTERIHKTGLNIIRLFPERYKPELRFAKLGLAEKTFENYEDP